MTGGTEWDTYEELRPLLDRLPEVVPVRDRDPPVDRPSPVCPLRRERYAGSWLPEPLLTDQRAPDPGEHAETADSLSLAFLVLLETLTPVERAVFLLHEVFGFAYGEIGELLDKTEENCRQIAARARRHVEARRPRFAASRKERDELATRLFAAIGDGDFDDLVRLLAADVVLVGDGGGKAPELREPLYGADRVARYLTGLARWLRDADLHLQPTEIKGQPGAITLDAQGRIFNVVSLDIADGQVQAIRGILNPDKLGHLGTVSDVARMLLEAREEGGRD